MSDFLAENDAMKGCSLKKFTKKTSEVKQLWQSEDLSVTIFF